VGSTWPFPHESLLNAAFDSLVPKLSTNWFLVELITIVIRHVFFFFFSLCFFKKNIFLRVFCIFIVCYYFVYCFLALFMP
jgi:hypothetical protein